MEFLKKAGSWVLLAAILIFVIVALIFLRRSQESGNRLAVITAQTGETDAKLLEGVENDLTAGESKWYNGNLGDAASAQTESVTVESRSSDRDNTTVKELAENGKDGKDGNDGASGANTIGDGDSLAAEKKKASDLLQKYEDLLAGIAQNFADGLYNGKDGAAGSAGAAGKDGATGAAGKDGATGAAGKDGVAGAAGKDGQSVFLVFSAYENGRDNNTDNYQMTPSKETKYMGVSTASVKPDSASGYQWYQYKELSITYENSEGIPTLYIH